MEENGCSRGEKAPVPEVNGREHSLTGSREEGETDEMRSRNQAVNFMHYRLRTTSPGLWGQILAIRRWGSEGVTRMQTGCEEGRAMVGASRAAASDNEVGTLRARATATATAAAEVAWAVPAAGGGAHNCSHRTLGGRSDPISRERRGFVV